MGNHWEDGSLRILEPASSLFAVKLQGGLNVEEFLTQSAPAVQSDVKETDSNSQRCKTRSGRREEVLTGRGKSI